MKKIVNGNNYNNSLIHTILGNETLNSRFIHFLQKEARESIHKSFISDKKTHYEAIDVYLDLCSQKSPSTNQITFAED